MSLQVVDPHDVPSTSAAGAMRDTLSPGVFLRIGPEPTPGTAARSLAAEALLDMARGVVGTYAFAATAQSDPEPGSVPAALAELRRLSGLTWDQLARLFRESRQTLHCWASGKPINEPNEERLRRFLAVLRKADRGTAHANRAILFSDRAGVIPFDLLAGGDYDEFLRVVGDGPGRRPLELTPLSPEAQEARRPLSPDELAGALQDRVHRDVARGRAARTVRSKRRGSGR